MVLDAPRSLFNQLPSVLCVSDCDVMNDIIHSDIDRQRAEEKKHSIVLMNMNQRRHFGFGIFMDFVECGDADA